MSALVSSSVYAANRRFALVDSTASGHQGLVGAGGRPSAHNPGERVRGTRSDSSQQEARGARWILWLLCDPRPKEMKGNKYFSC